MNRGGNQVKYHSFFTEPKAISISPSDTIFATGHKNGEVKVRSLSDFKETNVLKNHSDQLTCLAFTRDGTKLVTAGKDHQINVIDLRKM